MLPLVRPLALVPALLLPTHVLAGESETEESWSARFQTTYIYQKKPAFQAAYSGQNSLTTGREQSYTFSTTAYLGVRPWSGGELYLNPEVAQGVPFSALTGVGGFTNGEITRAAGTNPKLYRQRLFLRQTWNLGGGSEPVEADLNQLAGSVDKNRFVLTLGNFSTLDVFDDNAYAKDPRTQFMNWGNMAYAAYDYAADSRGFGWGFSGEWYRQDWVLRFGRMTGPKEPNMLPTDYRLGKHYGDQVEVEHSHEVDGQPGKIRLLAWRNRARLAGFQDALAYGNAVAWVPDPLFGRQYIFNVRRDEKIKYGLGVNAEQALSANVGVFLRAMQADGRSETYAFTEVDNSLAAGLAIKGGPWQRADDTVGVSLLRHGLSRERRRYLAAGGLSFFIGDGALRYRPEMVFEAYYSLSLVKGVWLTADYQLMQNPAYNGDRGPVSFTSLRFHAEY